MSQTEAATAGVPRKRGSEGVPAVPQPVRWVVLFTGSKATEDYQPFASAGEPEALIQEVTRMGVAFHPHSEIRLFPTKEDVLLFWQAKSTGDWIVTRVALAPNPQGVRTALEYVSLIFSAADLARLGHDPFRTLALGLHDKVREQFLAKKFEPISASLTVSTTKPSGVVEAAGAVSSDRASTPENIAALQALSAGRGEGSPPPPTFATWWASGGDVPSDYFEIVLRAAPIQVLTLREAGEAAGALAAEIKASLPNSPAGDAVAAEMARGLLRNADTVSSEVAGAGSHLNDESADQFRGRLTEAARVAGQVSADLTAYGRRLGGGVIHDASRLEGWASRYDALARDLPKVRHPNPFAAARNTTGATSSGAARTGAGSPTAGNSAAKTSNGAGGNGTKYGMIAAAVAVLGLGGFAAMQMKSGGGKETAGTASTAPAPQSSPHIEANSRTSGTVKNPAEDDGLALMKKSQATILPSAKKQAQEEAKKAALAAGSAGLSENAVEKITFNAVKMGYKETLSADDFKKSFTRSTPWTYATLQQALPTLIPTVHEAAVVGATEAKAAVALQAAQERAKIAATTVATPKPTRTNDDTKGETTKQTRTAAKRDSGGDSEKPKSKPPKSSVAESSKPPKPPKSVTSSAPKAGSADQTGL